MSDLKPCRTCRSTGVIIDGGAAFPCHHCGGRSVRRAPLTVADCLDVAEVRALVNEAHFASLILAVRHPEAHEELRTRLAPFLAAMEEKP